MKKSLWIWTIFCFILILIFVVIDPILRIFSILVFLIWFILALIMSIIIMSRGKRKVCPFCKISIHKDAIVCPKCHKDLPN